MDVNTGERNDVNKSNQKIIDLSDDSDLTSRIGTARGSQKYTIIKNYILENIGNVFSFSDGKELIASAKYDRYDDDVEHNKFKKLIYYLSNAKY